ncbi:DNA helicase RecQ [Solimonas sp. K1W22B-7]|uniref:DNA helicase RecQ n=1 Tax=Solimonas sp. K1W22B-7 TaxID=2303331 RepID=UPI000E32D5FB|nr:DNA helicase RecQ [Solimonas sp. K1W22B-7]AXQ29958.1 DNA helicase RecQ [Solimonas sp. K1W22B-7]
MTATDPLHAELKRHFGFDSFRPGQEAVVRDALAGRDLLAIMPTGGGKSLCFQLPALLKEGVMVVVSPLIALMQDQVRLLADNGIAATFLNSTLSGAEAAQRIQALRRGETRLLYVAPERLLSPGFIESFLQPLRETVGISAFTIDEAHCVSEWGHDFRPEYRQLSRLRELFSDVPVFAFTATATQRVREDIARQLSLHQPALHVASFNRPNLYYAVKPRGARSFDELLAHARSTRGSGIVYCLSRKRVDELSSELQAAGIAALPYHAGLDGETRREHQDRYIRDDVQVMVATVAFGMGINKPDVRWVIHYDLPRSMEGYYQEAGRAGRDGEPAGCILYFGMGDIRTAEFLIAQKVHPQTGEPLEDEQRIARQQLRQVLDYADSTECRRAVQLRYFGEPHPGSCGNCDNCINPRPLQDWTLEAKQLLSAVARLAQRRQRYGAGTVIDILRGAKTEKLISAGHDTLTVYGIGAGRSAEDWRSLTRSLLQQGVLEETHDGYPVLLLNAASWEVLRGERTVQMAAPVAAARGSGKGRAAKAAVAAGVVPDSEEDGLFEALRALRKKIATEHGVPPYVVFNDASLRAMARERPTDQDAFAGIPGVGAKKLDEYGWDFTALIREWQPDKR